MKFGSAKYLELVERRLELLRTLVRIEAEWRVAFIALKLEDSERSVAEEELVCNQIRALDKQIAALKNQQRKPATGGANAAAEPISSESWPADPNFAPQIREALERMAILQRELKRANDTRRAILRRSACTMNALRNLFNSYAPTYGAPAALQLGAMYEESV